VKLNGARDTGPRIALWLLGYGGEIWTHNQSYWIWGPWIGAIVGGLTGGLIYDSFIYSGRDSWLNRPMGLALKINDHESLGQEGQQA
jgi:aquaglyceroporin related protein